MEDRKRSRRPVAQLLADYQAELEKFDDAAARRRARLVDKIEKLAARHELIALGREAIGNRTPEEAAADLDAQLAEIRRKRKAVRRLSKTA